MWAYIKKALNSSLGTNDFLPLNEIILGQRSLVASDAPFYTLLSSSVSTDLQSPQTAADFVARTNGSVRIVVNARASLTDRRIDIGIYENDILIDSGKVIGPDATDVSFDIKIVKGNAYKIKFNSYDGYTVRINNIKINANIVDGSLIEEV